MQAGLRLEEELIVRSLSDLSCKALSLLVVAARRIKGLLVVTDVVVVTRQSQEYFASLSSQEIRIAPESKERASVMPCQGRSSSCYLVTT